jgi:hypothetical protein
LKDESKGEQHRRQKKLRRTIQNLEKKIQALDKEKGELISVKIVLSVTLRCADDPPDTCTIRVGSVACGVATLV